MYLRLMEFPSQEKSMAAKSPTDDELANGANWELVNNGKAGSAKKDNQT